MSKRGQDMQGGFERYGAMSGQETPTDTPTRATPAQLARRKIAGIKGRPAVRPSSPASMNGNDASFSAGFGSTNQAAPSFNFSQPAANDSNSFSQSQSQPSSNIFSFGQSNTSSSTPFSFGAGSQPQSESFSFGFNAAGPDPGAIRNPFAQANGSQSSQDSASAGSTGFSFNFGQKESSPANANGSSTPMFSFGAAPQSDLSAQERSEIMERQMLLSTEQLQRFEDLVKDKVAMWDGNVKSNKLESLPTDLQRKLLDFVRSLPQPTGSETRAAFGLFGDQTRGKTIKWVTDAQRYEIKKSAGTMPPEQQEKLAQVARDSFGPFKNLKSAEMPALEQLPHDIQHRMLEFVRGPRQESRSSGLSASIFANSPSTTAKDAPSSAKTNPFGGFGSSKPTPSKPTTESSIPNNVFSNISATASPAERRQSMAQEPVNATSKSPSLQSEAPKSTFSFSTTTEATPGQSKSANSAPAPNLFSFNSPTSKSSALAPVSASTITSPSASNGSTPVPSGSSQAQSNGFGSNKASQIAPPGATPNIFSSQKTSTTNNANAHSTTTNMAQFSGQWSIRDLNRVLLKHLLSCSKDDDWSPVMNFYLQRATQAKHDGQTSVLSSKRKAHEQIDQSRYGPTANQQTTPSSTTDKQSALTSFNPTSQKPLSQTASLFNDILAAPDKPQQQSAAKPSGFTPAAPDSRSSSVPTFNAAPTNFMTAFGQKAQKQAEKDKAERKAEEFDSDEDDEAEWERKDKERQEVKLKETANASKKTMKMVNGQFVWVDESDTAQPGSTNGNASESELPKKSTPASLFASQTPSSSSVPPANPFSHLSSPKPSSDVTPKPTSNLFSQASDLNSSIFADKPSQAAPSFQFSAPTASPAKESTTPTGSPAKPATGFSFSAPAANAASEQNAASTPKFNFGSTTSMTGSSLFSAPTPSSGSSSLFNKPATSEGASSSTTQGSSLFSNLSSSNNNGTSGAAPTAGSSLFSGGATSSLFSNTGSSGSSLFPNTTTSGSSSLFASPNLSRATTPGVSTDGQGKSTEDEDDDETPKEEQRDLTALSADEVKSEDVLFESRSRLRKFIRGAEDPWEMKGVGVVRLLKNKETGMTRMLMRQDPSGNILLNSSLLKQKDMYSNMNETNVKVTLPGDGQDLATYRLTFPKGKGSELVKAIHDVL